MLIAPETFVVLFIMVAIAGLRFNYWVIMFCGAYITGIVVSTELSKLWGWM